MSRFERLNVIICRDSSNPWGFRIQGGADYDTPLTVDRVTIGGASDGHLKPGDRILAIADQLTTGYSHSEATRIISSIQIKLHLTILRPVDMEPSLTLPRRSRSLNEDQLIRYPRKAQAENEQYVLPSNANLARLMRDALDGSITEQRWSPSAQCGSPTLRKGPTLDVLQSRGKLKVLDKKQHLPQFNDNVTKTTDYMLNSIESNKRSMEETSQLSNQNRGLLIALSAKKVEPQEEGRNYLAQPSQPTTESSSTATYTSGATMDQNLPNQEKGLLARLNDALCQVKKQFIQKTDEQNTTEQSVHEKVASECSPKTKPQNDLVTFKGITVQQPIIGSHYNPRKPIENYTETSPRFKDAGLTLSRNEGHYSVTNNVYNSLKKGATEESKTLQNKIGHNINTASYLPNDSMFQSLDQFLNDDFCKTEHHNKSEFQRNGELETRREIPIQHYTLNGKNNGHFDKFTLNGPKFGQVPKSRPMSYQGQFDHLLPEKHDYSVEYRNRGFPSQYSNINQKRVIKSPSYHMMYQNYCKPTESSQHYKPDSMAHTPHQRIFKRYYGDQCHRVILPKQQHHSESVSSPQYTQWQQTDITERNEQNPPEISQRKSKLKQSANYRSVADLSGRSTPSTVVEMGSPKSQVPEAIGLWEPPSNQPNTKLVHAQYNSPMRMYTPDNVADMIEKQTGSKLKWQKKPHVRFLNDIADSPTYQFLQELEQKRAPSRAASEGPRNQSRSFTYLSRCYAPQS